jgi:hypothetical protein
MIHLKKFCFTAIFIAATFSLSAQDGGRSFNFGLHVSPNLGWMKSDVDQEVYKSEGVTMHLGYGAEFNYFFIKNLGFGTGVNINYAGGKLKYHTLYDIGAGSVDTVEGILTRKYRLQYIEVPLVLIGTTGDLLGKFSIYGKFGLGSSFKIKARSDDDFLQESSQAVFTKENKDISGDVSFFRESMIIGLGGTYKVAKIISLNFCITYNNNFTDILTGTNAGNPSIKENAKANYIDLSVGVLF